MELDTLVCIINAPMTQHSFTFTSTLSYQRKTYNKNPQVTLAFAGPLTLALSFSLCSPITVAEIAISRQLPQIGFLNWWQTQCSAHCGAGTGTGTGREREGRNLLTVGPRVAAASPAAFALLTIMQRE